MKRPFANNAMDLLHNFMWDLWIFMSSWKIDTFSEGDVHATRQGQHRWIYQETSFTMMTSCSSRMISFDSIP